MSLSDYYTQSVVLYARTTSTGWASEPGFAATGTTVKAAVNMVSARERQSLARENIFVDWKMFMSDTVTITEAYRAVWDSRTLNVVQVKDTLQLGHHKRVLLVEPQ